MTAQVLSVAAVPVRVCCLLPPPTQTAAEHTVSLVRFPWPLAGLLPVTREDAPLSSHPEGGLAYEGAAKGGGFAGSFLHAFRTRRSSVGACPCAEGGGPEAQTPKMLSCLRQRALRLRDVGLGPT